MWGSNRAASQDVWSFGIETQLRLRLKTNMLREIRTDAWPQTNPTERFPWIKINNKNKHKTKNTDKLPCVSTSVPCAWRGRVSGRWGNNNAISWLLQHKVWEKKHNCAQFSICVVLQDENHAETKIVIVKKSGASLSRGCGVTPTSTTSWRSLMVKSCRLLPPTLSAHDVPGRAGGGAPLHQSLNFWLHL